MIKQQGFNLIELLMFIVVLSILASTVLLGAQVATRGVAFLSQDLESHSLLQGCIENYIGIQKNFGYNDSRLVCANPVSPVNLPNGCASTSSYAISVRIECVSLQGDASYKIITASISGKNRASLSTLIAKY